MNPYNADPIDIDMLREWLVEEAGGVAGLSDSPIDELSLITSEIDELEEVLG